MKIHKEFDLFVCPLCYHMLKKWISKEIKSTCFYLKQILKYTWEILLLWECQTNKFRGGRGRDCDYTEMHSQEEPWSQ